jgi:hypothetical protein
VRVYSELMLEIQHMHELDCVCEFVMGLPTWAKQKLEENWPSSLSEAIMKVEGFSDVGQSEKSGFKKDNKCRNPTLAKCGVEAQHLEKLEVRSLPGLPNVQSSTARGKTPRIGVFLVSLKRS